MAEKVNVRFGGFGGQGIVTMSIILGNAAVLHDRKDAVQTQSYGQQARGGECRSEVIISDETITYPVVDEVDALIIMSKPALKGYIDTLKPGGYLIVDPDVAGRPERKDIEILEIPATVTAAKLGKTIVANSVMLGALVEKTKIVTEEGLLKSIENSVAPAFVDINLKAAKEGIRLARS